MPILAPVGVGSGLALQDMYTLANSASYNSRTPVEVWAKLNSAGKYIYDWIRKENPEGVYLVIDASFLSFVADQEEYALPVDLETIVRFRERLNAQDQWRRVSAESLSSDNFIQSQFGGAVDFSGPTSDFTFAGPYLLEADVDSANEQKRIRVAPIPREVRACELVYQAKWIQINKAASKCNIPMDARDAMVDFAAAELLDLNDDSMADKIRASADRKLTLVLDGLRKQQVQQVANQIPYLDDLD